MAPPTSQAQKVAVNGSMVMSVARPARVGTGTGIVTSTGGPQVPGALGAMPTMANPSVMNSSGAPAITPPESWHMPVMGPSPKAAGIGKALISVPGGAVKGVPAVNSPMVKPSVTKTVSVSRLLATSPRMPPGAGSVGNSGTGGTAQGAINPTCGQGKGAFVG